MPIAQSAHVQSYEYDAERGVVTIQFVNGAVYEGPMSESEYWNFHQSGSKGAYVNDKLRGRLTKIVSAPPGTRKRRVYGRDY